MERLGPDAFDGDRLRRPGTWAVAFSADWCPYCRRFVADLERLAGTGPFEVAMGDLTDEDSPLWEQFRVDVVPTVVVFRDGAPSFRRDGVLGHGLTADDLHQIRAALGGR
jgi:thioredoxin 1